MSGSKDVPDVNYNGWASRLKIDFPWEKFNFGVVGMYATGSMRMKLRSAVFRVQL